MMQTEKSIVGSISSFELLITQSRRDLGSKFKCTSQLESTLRNEQ